jgi:hypothetical protein
VINARLGFTLEKLLAPQQFAAVRRESLLDHQPFQAVAAMRLVNRLRRPRAKRGARDMGAPRTPWGRAREAQDHPADRWRAEVDAARRWALEMGRTARYK